MTPRIVITLAAALAVLLGILLIIGQPQQAAQGPGEALFASMRNDLNDVNAVTITGAGDSVIATLNLVDDQWVVSERHDYPADTGKLRQLLLALADAQLIEAKTANPAYYPRLGVGDIKADDANGVLVQIATPSSNYNVIVGDQTQGEYRYVRRADEAQSWLIDKNLQAPKQAAEWLDRTVINILAEQVQSVRIEHPDGQTLELIKSDPSEEDFKVMDVPANRELLYPSVANVVAGVLENLTFDDVELRTEAESSAVITTYQTFDGQVIDVRSAASNGAHWIHVAARYAADATAATDTDSANQDIEALNQRIMGWRYQVPQYKYEQLTRRWQDLLKDEA